MRSHLLPLSSSSRSLLLRSLASPSSQSCLPLNQLGRSYGSSHGQAEREKTRAPSTAEEFKRVAEEKLREVEKTYDATEEATSGDGKPESVKERYKHHEPGADNRKRTHDDDDD